MRSALGGERSPPPRLPAAPASQQESSASTPPAPVELTQGRCVPARAAPRRRPPWIGLPRYRLTVGMARLWHFLSVLFWVLNGLVFVVLLFPSGQWKRLVPGSLHILPDAWAV